MELPIKVVDDEYAFRCVRHLEGKVQVIAICLSPPVRDARRRWRRKGFTFSSAYPELLKLVLLGTTPH